MTKEDKEVFQKAKAAVYYKKRYALNKEYKIKKNLERIAKNKDKVKAYQKKRYRANREKKLAQNKEWYYRKKALSIKES